jgi:trigger factor
MQVAVEQLDPCKLALTVELDAEKVAETIEKVFNEYGNRTTIPGFRKGKAPRQLIESRISPEYIREAAIDELVPDAYFQALKDKDIHPYASPEVEIVEFEPGKPFIFKAMVPLPPKVELGEYKGIKIERSKVKITDKDVKDQLKYLQESKATSKKVEDRGVQTGDILIASISSVVEGQEKTAPRRSLVEVGANVPEFDEKIIGLNPGEQRTFTVEYPKDHPEQEMAGKKVEFDVSAEDIREREIPELNDEFAKAMGFETLAKLRQDVKARMTAAAEENADREVERKMVDEIVTRSKISCPDVLIEHEIGHDIEEIQARLEKQGLNLELYLKQIGKTQDEMISELREAATRRVHTGLVLGEVSEAEKMDIADEEVDAEIERMAAESKATKEAVDAYIEARGGRIALKNSMLNRKLLDFLKSVSTIK